MTRFFARHLDALTALALFLGALIVYLKTLCPTVYWGDCGELAASAYTLGIAHPTGYPLWCLLGKLWTLIVPFGSIIWRLNTMSAFFGALAVAALYAFGRAVHLPRPVAFLVAGIFGSSFTFWQQCLFCETYSLTACYTCTLLWLAARWRARGCRDADLRLLAVAYGLAMTNHQTNTLFLPGFAAFVLWTEPTLRRLRDAGTRRRWLALVLPGLLPLLFYAYLPLRAMANPAVNWNDPQTPFNFFYHVTGRTFSGLMFHSEAMHVILRVRQWAFGLPRELTLPLVGLALLGMGMIWRRGGDRPLAFLLTWIIIADVFYTTNYAIYNAYIYYLPSHIALLGMAGCGLHRAWCGIESAITAPRRPALAALAGACLLLLVPIRFGGNWHRLDLSRNWTCYDYGRNLLTALPNGTLLIDDSDTIGTPVMCYLQKVEGYRTDVAAVNRGMLMDAYDEIFGRWVNICYIRELERKYPAARHLRVSGALTPAGARNEGILKRLIADAVKSGRPVYADPLIGAHPIPDDRGREMKFHDYLAEQWDLVPAGLTIRLTPKGAYPSPAARLAEARRTWKTYTLRGVYDGLYKNDDFLTPLALEYAYAGLNRADLAVTQGAWAEAEQNYSDVLKLFDNPQIAARQQFCAARLVASKLRSGATVSPARDKPRGAKKNAYTEASR